MTSGFTVFGCIFSSLYMSAYASYSKFNISLVCTKTYHTCLSVFSFLKIKLKWKTIWSLIAEGLKAVFLEYVG